MKRKTTIEFSTPRGGRKKLPNHLKRKRFAIYLNEEEEELVLARQREIQYNFSGYIRYVLLDETRKPAHPNPVAFLNSVSELAKQVNKVGININQIAKYVNQLILND
ncbi:hypothetical protein [Aurantibacter sp.]|uniref:hypothetical protein n=1 Tax=Aurantibacter sp. TaxID=2807103 RepID=UPI003265903A